MSQNSTCAGIKGPSSHCIGIDSENDKNMDIPISSVVNRAIDFLESFG